ncbi:class I SAM-dependent methyltransferase [Patescibacteria group bacterium]|nr:class I SAM-dependent methyltransferase [Patescibacteria group bacterium]MBU1673973.1 class I SAM-dependent methyltransferase [Patescibacteria group bacterium]MBU1962953.1 class I SAM-dependent methyltransferase [Patescibacteria group bacterium]
MQPSQAREILAQVKADYDKIAPHFAQTRAQGWSEYEEFKPYLKKGDEVLDLGCGNGRLVEFLIPLGIKYTGCDNSNQLLKFASEKYTDTKFVVGDFMHPPFEKEEFDVVMAIASLHHVPSGELRLRALKEIYRILKPGGYLLMTNWYLYQKKYKKYIKNNKGKMDKGDAIIPWKDKYGNTQAERYYHAFKQKELSKLARQIGFKVISQNMNESKQERNIVSIWKK